ncbi:hypothetical protein DRW07_16525 [Alteromonas sediminis]|uniref:Uncharacterized protein n=1 Tax=Alteromonas sediminis TaxID=2259342 RepID=A0A3N5Y4C2_9ALTE|nr:hypothetical protein [Alteromonas sediminis]RPJ64929.1 hypothetical protein DRW07_16525 [Alteromonas sediminis]
MKKTLTYIIAISFSVSAHAYKQREQYDIKWKEDSGKIVNSTVCFSYQKGSLDYRGCRSAAKNYFKQQCHIYRKKNLSKLATKKFCNAASSYNPIRS